MDAFSSLPLDLANPPPALNCIIQITGLACVHNHHIPEEKSCQRRHIWANMYHQSFCKHGSHYTFLSVKAYTPKPWHNTLAPAASIPYLLRAEQNCLNFTLNELAHQITCSRKSPHNQPAITSLFLQPSFTDSGRMLLKFQRDSLEFSQCITWTRVYYLGQAPPEGTWRQICWIPLRM
jgi:hypothetical protein